MLASVPSCSQPLYAVIDLGSNSFHMLISRLVADSVQVVDKVKRKVRLASGLNEDNILDHKAMARGWECLSFFAERLQDIPTENIKIVATATLRLAKNSADFISKAETILGHKIELISGEEEAHNIYLGVAHTTCSADKRLVIDIGGASTELIVGSGFDAKKVCSLNMGCVTFNNEFFAQGVISEQAFNRALDKAKAILLPQAQSYIDISWDSALGVSGTLQAVAEVLTAQGKVEQITLANLLEIKQQVVACKSIEQLDIVGLDSDRKPVFVSGLAILTAIFMVFQLDEVQLAGGAIREGILYELLPNMRNVSIRQRTVIGLIQRFSIDERHAYRVANLAGKLFAQVANKWQLSTNVGNLLQSACVLHEIGLLLEYKGNKKHAQYILENTDLAGFSNSERKLLIALVTNYKTDPNTDTLYNQSFTTTTFAIRALVILRLAVALSKRRTDDVLRRFELNVEGNSVDLVLESEFMTEHPLIAAELTQEVNYLAEFDINFSKSTFAKVKLS
ncbi:MAG: guanosine-5'-triphosphate,3'-diphosphate pyrophosphatase [Moritella sp.]|uniref:Ppx/GppA phosphatase family protein n=1 Tax=Moritella sp. TaxID=78556 RepID=UPI0029A25D55|nr:guanosine-5'-triphosphate,3'-diphosphate pyrophosphatase [Moritella sp.]MDX2320465.1 guanosine-5'-triphosphate,3'-diphosphate pyrophosphatase [Moritella sp.]